MKNTRHQLFINELQKLLADNNKTTRECSIKQDNNYNGNTRKEDIITDIVKKYDKLFAEMDDDDY